MYLQTVFLLPNTVYHCVYLPATFISCTLDSETERKGTIQGHNSIWPNHQQTEEVVHPMPVV